MQDKTIQKFYIQNKELYSPSLCVDRVWVINGDSTYYRDFTEYDEKDLYNLSKHIKPNTDDNIVALRTTEGSGELELDGKRYTLTPNSLIFFKRNQKRKYYATSNKWYFTWTEFKCDYLFFELNKVMCKELTNFEKTHTRSYIRFLKDNRRQKFASTMFALVMLNWLEDSKVNNHNYTALINSSIAYIRKNFCNPSFTVAEVAKHCSISERLFRTEFAKITGKNPRQYIIDMRMTEAKSLLTETTLPIYTIAERVGYSDQHIFSTRFTREVNISPSQFRRNIPNKIL